MTRSAVSPHSRVTILPVGIYPYVDKVTVWLKRPLIQTETAWIAARCRGKVEIKRNGEWIWISGRSTRVWHPNRAFQQRVQLYQPSDEVLEWLADRNDVRLTYFEPSLDLIFKNEEDWEDAYRFICKHHVKLYHRTQKVAFVGERGCTRYSGPRKAPNVMVVYCDRPSKVTGEYNCVHFDWRIKGFDALCRAGIKSIRHWLNMDKRKFWSERILLQQFNLNRLGEVHRSWYYPKKRLRPRTTDTGHLPYDVDRRTGSIIVRKFGSTQAVLDYASRKKFDARKCLVPIDIDDWLPRNEALPSV